MDSKSTRRQLTRLFLVLIDIVLLNLSALAAILLRVEFEIDFARSLGFFDTLRFCALPATLIALFVFRFFNLYSSRWEYAGERELLNIGFACVCVSVFYYVFATVFRYRLPRSFPVVYALILFVCVAFFRFLYRRASYDLHARSRHIVRKRTMVIGAGTAGAMAIREFDENPASRNKAVCLIDDDPAKQGSRIRGVRVVGKRDAIPEAVKKYDVEEVVFCIPSASLSVRNEILEICSGCGVVIKTLPTLSQLANGEVTLQQVRSVSIEDLLGRTQVNTDNSAMAPIVEGRTVLVTGGGGSIGSELCRQLAALRPGRLIIFDIYENNAYDIQMELKRKHPELDLVVLIGSVRDEQRVRSVFERYRPAVVCHAAAHKHVPLMEDSPAESIKNNVFGTYKVARAACDYDTELFILISTDKAVNPTNVMGASKRLCEMIVQSMNGRGGTNYIAVRFGNVLGSNGSVIPLFKKQIAEGGPVTVTDKRVTRFFMTIPEAVSLILQAGAYAKGGEVFVLDMGEPVRIDDMARKMIRLSGFEPDVDIKIEYTGLRPGEKLYEELLLKSEGLQKTDNSLIYIGHQVMYTPEQIEEKMDKLRAVLYAENPEVRACMLSLIQEPQDSMYEEIPIAHEDEAVTV
ncbi:MAG: polysaccharide biosynthesis protein [Oscillospiraceae bacterium]|nr:polysaccharide biosynthesis protein [Oscillospiraceae bacterium]